MADVIELSQRGILYELKKKTIKMLERSMKYMYRNVHVEVRIKKKKKAYL